MLDTRKNNFAEESKIFGYESENNFVKSSK